MPGRFLRDNIFLVAAVVLPLGVVAFFLAASAIPRWTVPPPQYDLLVEAGTYAQPSPTMAVDFEVRGERVVVTVGPMPPNSYPGRIKLFRVDHATGHMREVTVSLPDNVKPDDPPREIRVQELSEVRVIAKAEAPDGYLFDARARRSPGLLGDLFGMRRYDAGHVLVNRGRVVKLTPPPQHDYLSPVGLLGWIVPEGR
jgi:hypothetical protein